MKPRSDLFLSLSLRKIVCVILRIQTSTSYTWKKQKKEHVSVRKSFLWEKAEYEKRVMSWWEGTRKKDNEIENEKKKDGFSSLFFEKMKARQKSNCKTLHNYNTYMSIPFPMIHTIWKPQIKSHFLTRSVLIFIPIPILSRTWNNIYIFRFIKQNPRKSLFRRRCRYCR